MKKLYLIDYETGDGFDQDDLLVIDDTQDPLTEAQKHLRKLGHWDEETGELFFSNVRVYPAAAFDLSDNEYEIELKLKETK